MNTIRADTITEPLVTLIPVGARPQLALTPIMAATNFQRRSHAYLPTVNGFLVFLTEIEQTRISLSV